MQKFATINPFLTLPIEKGVPAMRNVFFALLVSAAFCVGAEKDTCTVEKPAMELGGLVTTDFDARTDSLRNGQIQMGWVELGATVNICDEVTGAIVIRAESELDKMKIVQAMASYKPSSLPSLQAYFGQFTFNHGVLATHLISFPLIYDAVILTNPGLTLNYSIGKFTPGLGFTILHTEDPLAATSRNDYAGIINLDYALGEESLLRLSSLMDSVSVDVDLGTSFSVGKFIVDAEVFSKYVDWKTQDIFGYYAGVDYSLFEKLSVAARYEGISEDGVMGDLTHRIAGGITFNIAHGIFAAAEFAHVIPFEQDAFQEIGIQLGLQSTLKLPGFQPKKLTNE
jgi:hypothetical protein